MVDNALITDLVLDYLKPHGIDCNVSFYDNDDGIIYIESKDKHPKKGQTLCGYYLSANWKNEIDKFIAQWRDADAMDA